MTVADAIIMIGLGVFLSLQTAALIIFSITFFRANSILKDLSESLMTLTSHLQFLPDKLYGLPNAVGQVARSVELHEKQVQALVAVIQQNVGVTPEMAPPKGDDPLHPEWDVNIPASMLSEDQQ